MARMNRTMLSLSRCQERSLIHLSECNSKFGTHFARNLVGRRTCRRLDRSIGRLQGSPSILHATCLRVAPNHAHRVQCSPGQSDRVSSGSEISNASEDTSRSNGNEVGFASCASFWVEQ